MNFDSYDLSGYGSMYPDIDTDFHSGDMYRRITNEKLISAEKMLRRKTLLIRAAAVLKENMKEPEFLNLPPDWVCRMLVNSGMIELESGSITITMDQIVSEYETEQL